MGIPAMTNGRDASGSTGLGWLRNKRILLAEDNITNQMVATQMLDALGARVDVANDGAEALEMIEQRAYDIYLIDIEMPRVSGLDVIRAIREAAAPLCDAPVIAVTAYALREHREKIAEAGADGLIPKPLVGIEQFGRDIMNFTERSRRRAESAGDRSAAARDVDEDAAAPVKAAGPVSLGVFNALAEAIGPEAMRDLLGKIDSDLAKAEGEVAEGVATSDKALVSSATHVLISVAGAVGATPLQKLAQRLNAASNGKSEEDAHALGSELGIQIKVLRAFLAARAGAAGS
ncbi:MAG: response regulator [Rhodobacteraceae bacterium]|nr:MAG: response regulator [Paracoccaceae bacterium]